MRKLAPTILFASITALIGGTALAATGDTTSPSTDKAATAPSVHANTSNPQGLSYSDKSNTSPGTNAKDVPTPDTMNQPQQQAGVAMDDQADTTKKVSKHKAKKAKVVKDGDLATTNSAPIDSTNGAAVNSTTGTSGGR